MLLFGHVGITLGAVVLLTDVLKRINSNNAIDKTELASASSSDEKVARSVSESRVLRAASLASRKNTKSLILGSLLPDIIDKPVGLGIFKNTFSNGRIFAHTLLFPAILAAFGSLLYRSSGKTWGFSLALGSFVHLLLDKMWREPKTLFWPLFGLRFKKMDISNWLAKILYGLFNDPKVYKPEIIGAMMLLRLKERRHGRG